jgi:hypothetical protein
MHFVHLRKMQSKVLKLIGNGNIFAREIKVFFQLRLRATSVTKGGTQKLFVEIY